MKEKNGITFTVERVTPDMAKQWLEKNHARQRGVVMGHVRFLADQMKSGQWAMNGESLIFDRDGNILDGQHRLTAVVVSGSAVEFAIVRGVSDDAMDSINTGKSRTNGNIFTINEIPNGNHYASFAYLIWRYRRAIAAGGSINMSWTRPSARDLMDIYNSMPDAFSFGKTVGERVRKSTGLPPSIVGACAALAIEAGHETDKVEWFFDRFCDGANLPLKSPILALSNQIKKDNTNRAKLPADIRFAMLVKAFNLYSEVKEARSIIVQAGEKFPKIVDP